MALMTLFKYEVAQLTKAMTETANNYNVVFLREPVESEHRGFQGILWN